MPYIVYTRTSKMPASIRKYASKYRDVLILEVNPDITHVERVNQKGVRRVVREFLHCHEGKILSTCYNRTLEYANEICRAMNAGNVVED